MIRTTDDLLKKIKKKSFIPTSQSTFTDEELLEIATEEMNGIIVPTILSTRQDYYVYKDESSILDGTQNQTFNIPHRASGMQVREVSATIGGTERNMPRFDIEDRIYDGSGGSVFGFDITNNQINVKGSSRGVLNLYYYLRPGDLVKSTQSRRVLSVDVALKQIVVANFLSTWTTSTVFDVIKDKPGFDHKAINLSVSSLDSGTGTITFNEDLPSATWAAIVAGDWLTEAETSPVPQLPIEWQEYLAEAVTAYMMESIGDAEAFTRSVGRKEELKKLALSSISPRVDGQSRKSVPRRNRGSYIYTRWWGY